MEIHQLLPNFVPADAISNHAWALRRLLRTWGYTSDIYAQSIHPHVAVECRPLAELPPTADVVIYHYSTTSAEAGQAFRAARGKRVILYHNMTPAHFYAPYCETTYRFLREGRANLGCFRDVTDLTLGVSPYNCAELAAAGYADPRVLPVLVEFEALAEQTPCPITLQRFDDGWQNFLFVGRLAPHKRQEDVIRAFAWYNHFVNRRARLFLVGSAGGLARYPEHLHAVVHSVHMQEHVHFTGAVTPAELLAYYRLAHVFLCMSEHEGLGIPLLEAMYCDVPILAYAAAGVPDTLGEAGILVRAKDYPLVAELADLLVEDAALRRQVIRRQRERVTAFAPAVIATRFRGYLEELVAA